MPARWGWSWVALPTDTPELLIGTYTLTTSDYRFAISGSTFFVESFRTNPNTTEISVELIELLVDGGGPEGHPEEERALVRDDSAP